jgi:hypothetical protein
MISKDLRFFAFDTKQYANLFRLMDPPAPQGDAPPSKSKGAFAILDRIAPADAGESRELPTWHKLPLLVLHRKGAVQRIARLGGGCVEDHGLTTIEKKTLRALRKGQGVPFVVAIELDALPDLWAEVQQAVDLNDDLVAQNLAMLGVFRKALDTSVHIEPRPLGNLPLPSYDLLRRTFDRLFPDDRSLVFYISEGNRLWTSIIVSKKKGAIQLVTSHKSIANEIPFRSTRQDAPRIVDVVTKRYGKPFLAAFIPLDVWSRFIEGERSAIARALAARTAVLDPAPAWIIALVGAGAVSDAANRSAKLAGKLLSRSPFGGKLIPRGAKKLAETISSPLEALGVDPWEMMNWSRLWMRRLKPLLYRNAVLEDEAQRNK